MITVRIDASEAAELVNKAISEVSGCSGVTAALIGQLLVRDSHGREKYGTSLDRTDLSLVGWLQHQAEELMDGAGYALAAKREAERLQRIEVAARRLVAELGHLDMSLMPGVKEARDSLRDLYRHTPTQAPDS